MKGEKIYSLYLRLYKKYGPPKQFWPQWCEEKKSLKLREVIALGAILTQRTSWHNADLALRNLKKEKLLSLKRIAAEKDVRWLRELIRPAGFGQTKPSRLVNFASFIVDNYGSLANFADEDLSVARRELLSLDGIGPETADSILLYAVDKPTFVIDEYTRRFVRREGLREQFGYDSLKEFFEKWLPREVEVYQNFHALIVINEKGEADSRMTVV